MSRLLALFLVVLAAAAPALGRQDTDALRELRQAFRPARDPVAAAAQRSTALAGVAGIDSAELAELLVEAYVRLEEEAEPLVSARRRYLDREGRDRELQARAELDPLRTLQDDVRKRLLSLSNVDSVRALVSAALDDGKLPASLRVALAGRAGILGTGALPLLEKALKTRRAATLTVALRGARSVGRDGLSLAPLVADCLEDPDPDVRIAAAQALGRSAAPTALEPLIERLRTEEGRARKHVVRALQQLTGRKIGATHEGWTRWLEEEGGPYLDGSERLGQGLPIVDDAPPETGPRYHGLPLDGESIVFVVDFSRSMRNGLHTGVELPLDGEDSRWKRAKDELVRALGQLSPRQKFNVVTFAGRCRKFQRSMMPADEGTVADAVEWLEEQPLELGTAIYDALEVAFELAGRGKEDRYHELQADTVFLLTDGRPYVGGKPDSFARILSAVRRWNLLSRVTVHVIGLGAEAPRRFLENLAEQNGGLLRIEAGREDGEEDGEGGDGGDGDGGGDRTVPPADGAARSDRAPNFVVFLVDDMGWSDGGALGSRFYETPHLDRLLAEGRVFTSGYANGPNCAPSRASLMSGQYTPRHGIYTVGSPARGKAVNRKLVPPANRTVLADEVVTLAEALKAAGYATGTFGKWHLGADPRTQGFDVNVGGNRAGHPKSYFSPYRNPDLEDGEPGECLTGRLTDEALEFLEANRERPFFLYLTHYAVHTPIQARPEDAAAFRDKAEDRGHRNAKYAAMLRSTDASLGRVLARLEELGLAEDTLVCFLSDNGGHEGVTSNRPLRGAKGQLYEGGIRVPFVVRWKGRVAAGRDDTPVSAADLYPTFLDLAGGERAARQPLDGVSLAGLLLDGTPLERDALYWHFPAYLERRSEQDPWRTTPAGAVRRGSHKLLEFFEDGRLELYDLAADPGERRDLAAADPETTRELHAMLRRWRVELGAPVPTELNPEYAVPADGGR